MEKLHYLPCVLTLLMVFGSSATSFAENWSLEPLRSVEGFQIPECAEVNPANGTVYVSNIFGVTRDTFKALDSNGYISTLEIGGKVTNFHESARGFRAIVQARAKFGDVWQDTMQIEYFCRKAGDDFLIEMLVVRNLNDEAIRHLQTAKLATIAEGMLHD